MRHDRLGLQRRPHGQRLQVGREPRRCDRGGLPVLELHGLGTTGSCDTSLRDAPAVTVTGYVDVTSTTRTRSSAVAQQPVSVAIEADKSVFQLYSSGVLDSSAAAPT